MARSFSKIGGARLGMWNATWPLATLHVSRKRLRLYVALLGRYGFAPPDVVSLTLFGWLPVIGRGVKITHVRAGYPAHVVFWCFAPQKLIRRVHDAGFVPSAAQVVAPLAVASARRELPVNGRALVLAIVLINALALLDRLALEGLPPYPGIFTWLTSALLLALFSRLPRSPELQRRIMKQGRQFAEIAGIVRFLRLISAVLLTVTTIFLAVRLR